MDDKIMLNIEELNRVSGGNREDYYNNYRERIAENREEVNCIVRDKKCPRCRLSIRPVGNGKYACMKCWILWRLP